MDSDNYEYRDEYVNEDEYDNDQYRDEYDNEDNLDEYKTPDEDYFDKEEKDENDGYDNEDIVGQDDSYIDTGAEWRDFGDGEPSKSRVGQARSLDIDEDLSTIISDERFKKFGQMNKTPEDIFKTLIRDTISKYNVSKDIYEDSLRVMQLINKHNKRLKYRNPQAVVFALLVFTDRNIDKKKLDKIYEEKAKHENMKKIDLLRYAFFIENLRKL
jgi:transcription initiation factor TFIIIB Brf1 subunit/transcription initiation factor TFIIB